MKPLLEYRVTSKAALLLIKTPGPKLADVAFLLKTRLNCCFFYFSSCSSLNRWRLACQGSPGTTHSIHSTPNVAGFAMMGLRRHRWVVGCQVRVVAYLSPDPP